MLRLFAVAELRLMQERYADHSAAAASEQEELSESDEVSGCQPVCRGVSGLATAALDGA